MGHGQMLRSRGLAPGAPEQQLGLQPLGLHNTSVALTTMHQGRGKVQQPSAHKHKLMETADPGGAPAWCCNHHGPSKLQLSAFAVGKCGKLLVKIQHRA